MRVIILSAGKGERLYPLTRNLPKCLIQIAGGRTLLELQLESIHRCSVEEVVIVTGYRSEQIEAKVKSLQGPKITIQYNPFYDISNNLVSAWMACSYMDGDFVLLNGDDVFKWIVLRDLLNASGKICMVVDVKPAYDDDDMKVIHDGNRILRIGKDIDSTKANGESIGMIKFAGKGAGQFSRVLDEMVRSPANRQLFYLAAIQQLVNEGFDVSFVECAPDDWAEIDFHPDVELIRERIGSKVDLAKGWESPDAKGWE